MGTAELRPNLTIQAGTGTTLIGASSAANALGDNSTATAILNSHTTPGGNTTPSTAAAVVGLDDATGTLPAGRKIISVQFRIAGPKAAGTVSAGIVSLRYSDNIEAARLTFTTSTTATNEIRSSTFTSAVRYDGQTSKGPWTYALVDGLKCVVGSVMGSGKTAGRTNDIALVVTYSELPPTPTAVVPANNAVVTTFNPQLSATVAAIATGQKQHIEWQFSKSNTFASGIQTVTSPADVASGTITMQPTIAQLNLDKATWYVRARSVDEYGIAGSWSSTNTITVSHPGSATNQTPTGAVVRSYASPFNLSWTFTDQAAGDTQSAYAIQVESNETGASIIDTGKTTSSATTVGVTIPAGNKDEELRWRVKVWDSQDDSAGYSNWHNFMLSDAPVVTITAPADAASIESGAPAVTWTISNGTQASRTVSFKRAADDSLVHSNTATTTSLTYTPPSTILDNQTQYKVTVQVTDTDGLTGTDTNTFTTAYVAPDPVYFTIDATDFEESGYITVDWSGMEMDEFFTGWNVYRRIQGTSSWTPIASYDYDNRNTRTFKDWLVPAGDNVEYTVTQSGVRSGSVLESAKNESAPVMAYSTHYWIINPTSPDESLKVDHVVSDDFSDEYEEQAMLILGRGRKVNTGTRHGYSGSLVAQLRDNDSGTARSKRMKLQILKDSKTAYYLRNPFGDVLQIHIGNLQFSRIAGVGAAEFVDVTIPYMEVF
jgi:hypothetical protein